MSARAALILGFFLVVAALAHGGIYSAGHDFVVNPSPAPTSSCRPGAGGGGRRDRARRAHSRTLTSGTDDGVPLERATGEIRSIPLPDLNSGLVGR